MSHRDTITELWSGLYVSGYRPAQEIPATMPISAVLNVSQYPNKQPAPVSDTNPATGTFHQIPYRVHIPLMDHPDGNFCWQLQLALDTAFKLWDSSPGLLIHCAMGVSRSVVLCALVTEKFYRGEITVQGFDRSLRSVRQIRGIPNATSYIAPNVRHWIETGELS